MMIPGCHNYRHRSFISMTEKFVRPKMSWMCLFFVVISRGLDAPAKFAPTLKVKKAMHGTEEASNDGRV